MDIFEEKKKSFSMSCQLFRTEMAEYEELKNRKSLTAMDRQTIAFLETDINNVVDQFTKLKESCGTSSAVIMWKYYIEGKTMKEIADYFKISKLYLSKTINQYEHIMFD